MSVLTHFDVTVKQVGLGVFMKAIAKKTYEQKESTTAIKVSKISLIFEATLTIYKMFAGIIGHSGAMISDAVHSASDVFSTIVVMVGVKMAGKEADEKHPYGHERMESVAALILAVCLAITGIGIGYNAILIIYSGEYKSLVVPEKIALIAALVSIIVKEAMFWYARYYGKKLRSSALIADAWHHRSDAMSSIGSLIGIYGAQKGILILEPAASLVISIFIIKVAIGIFCDSLNEMMDCAGEAEVEEKIRELTIQVQGVQGICILKTRKFGTKLYVDLDIYVDCEMTLDDANLISIAVHDAIEEKFPVVKHVIVRVLPNCNENDANSE